MLKFSIPCVLSLLVSALYNIVDQIFIGNSELSTLGNAATGVVFPFFIIAQAFAWCFGDGCAAYLNICLGKKDMQSADKAIGTSICEADKVELAKDMMAKAKDQGGRQPRVLDGVDAGGCGCQYRAGPAVYFRLPLGDGRRGVGDGSRTACLVSHLRLVFLPHQDLSAASAQLSS